MANETQTNNDSRLDLAAIRARLDGVRGQQYWRSLDEIAETDEFKEMLHREFPDGASEWRDEFSRRSFLKLATASLALAGLSACTKQPVEEILPYVRQPDNLVLGRPLYYASTMLLGGYGTGVIAKSREGHPIKVDGNPDHPASLGGSSVWMQASILDLYDPDRSQAVTRYGDISSWATFLSDLNQLIRDHEANRGEGLRFLTETVTSPTLAAQLNDLLRRFPNAKWHQYDPASRDNVREGAQLAFGEIVEPQHRFDQADVIVSLDSDFLYTHPQRLRYTRDFTDGRRVTARPDQPRMNRLYVVESTPTVTGTMADHRMAMASGDIPIFARRLAEAVLSSQIPEEDSLFSAMVRDLQQNRGRSIVIAGEWQPPAVHALAHLLNDALDSIGNTVFYTEPADQRPVNQLQSLADLVDEMKSGAVQTLFILGGNPVYSAPADFEFGQRVRKIKRSIHLGLELDETGIACTWHIPQAHYLESWSDARSFDGTASLMQPLIAPLYNGRTAHDLLGAMVQPQPLRGSYDIVRSFWRAQHLWPDFESGWRRALHDGLIAGTTFPAKQVRLKVSLDSLALQLDRDVLPHPGPLPLGEGESQSASRVSEARTNLGGPTSILPLPLGGGEGRGEGAGADDQTPSIEVTFRPDPSIWDGRFANNGWLQECAKPINKLTWDNAVLISPSLAERFNLNTDDIVELALQPFVAYATKVRTVRGPVWIMPGQAENSITLHLGYGRERVGRVGAGVGFDVAPLRTSDSFWQANGVRIRKLNRRHHLVSTQMHHNLHGEERQIYRAGKLDEFQRNPDFVKETVESPPAEKTLYKPAQHEYDGYKWGMSIDLSTCIGCNACLLACNVENNIPVIGKEQVNLHREMYWIRIDTYYKGPLDNPEFHHMPVPCMHCEHAPCELVCPVQATVHDKEGLNLQIYNRCIGTRFCSNNCPYKVRRFNFLRYADYNATAFKPMHNPEVTVRWRGVMEKCTYCVQRIAAARIDAEKENRNIRDGEVQTACQQACPAQAIVFGNLNSDSDVARLKKHPLDYPMLGQLNVRPRTTYLAKLQNRNATIS